MLTRLDVINAMIVSTGSRPLLAGQTRHPMYLKADDLLTRVTNNVLAMGLWFNTELRTVTAQEDGSIIVPQNCIKADPLSRRYNLTLRARKMYDLDNGGVYTGGDLPLRMYFKLDFEQIDPVAQEYILCRARYEFFLNENGADPKLSSYRSERDNAWVLLWRDNTRNRQINVFDNPNSTVNRLRKGFPSGGDYRRRF